MDGEGTTEDSQSMRSPDYDLRVRQLLIDLEMQSKNHISEVNKIHEHYRYYVNQFKDMEERLKTYH